MAGGDSFDAPHVRGGTALGYALGGVLTAGFALLAARTVIGLTRHVLAAGRGGCAESTVALTDHAGALARAAPQCAVGWAREGNSARHVRSRLNPDQAGFEPRSIEIPAANEAQVNRTMDRDAMTRARLEQHWKASDRGDIDTEHAIYAADAILDYPQSGERFRGRSKIQAQRGGHPAERRFTILRIRGSGDLWVSECVITYDGMPTYAVSVMEFTDDLVTHETQYFADPFQAPPWRAALAEPIPGRDR